MGERVDEKREMKREDADETVEEKYEARPVTMGAISMWFPIILTVAGLAVAVITSITGVVISNSSRLAIIETLLQNTQNVDADQNVEIRRLHDNYQEGCRPHKQETRRG